MKNIQAKNVHIGKGVVIDPSASIRGLDGEADTIFIGDQTYIGADVQIICDDFKIGDYGRIHHHVNIHGYKPCHIGHNAWIGQYTIIDSVGGVRIGNNCGIGAHSQLWSHMKFGDMLAGCRFNSAKALEVGNDVWFVGHTIISPIVAEDRSMALVGSVVTKEMKYNEIYAGNPAVSISHKAGHQFKEIELGEKQRIMEEYLGLFSSGKTSIRIVGTIDEIRFDDDFSYFCVRERMYNKTSSEEEIAFMKFLLPEKAKFTPVANENRF